MPKIQPVSREEATPEQRRMADPIFEARGGQYGGPWGILLHCPELFEKAGALGSHLRDGASLPRRLSELVIAMTARNWTAQFEWAAHHRQGLAHGLAPELLEAIRVRERPDFTEADEEIVYDYVTELYANAGISDAVHRRALEALGVEGLVSIISVAGFYSYVAMVINAFDLEPRQENPPQPLPE